MFKRKFLLVIFSILVGLALLAAWGLTVAQAVQSTPASAQAIDPQAAPGSAPQAPDVGQRQPSGGDFVISHLENEQYYPNMAYNPHDDEYLVVWGVEGDIWGQRLSGQGAPRGAMFHVTEDGYQNEPNVAYNGTRQQYLVVWADDRGSDWDIYGQRVDADGTLLGNDFPISSAAGDQMWPCLVYNSVADDFLVAWKDERNSIYDLDIYARRVDGDGALLGAGEIAVSTADGDQWEVALAYNPEDDEYVAVWWDNRDISGSTKVYGQRIDADGDLINSNVKLADETGMSEMSPSIVYHPLLHRYLMVWSRWQSGYSSQLVYELFTLGLSADSPMYEIVDSASRVPDVSACLDPDSGQVLVSWQDARNSVNHVPSEYDIYAARIWKNGELATQGSFAITTQPEEQSFPAVGCSPVSHQFLVAYMDRRDTERTRLYGQRVWWAGQLIGPEFTIGVPDLAVSTPAVAFDERENRYLAVWSDDRNGDGDVFGQLFDRDGLPIEGNFEIYSGSGSQGNPDVAYNATSASYLVVWEDGQNRSVSGALVSPQGSLQYPPMIISSSVVTGSMPVVASNPEAAYNDFLVVFRQDADISSGNDVEARLVYPNGTLAPYGVHVNNLPGEQGLGDVVYNPTNHEYMVVFQNNTSGVYQITGQRVGPEYQLLGNKIAISTGGTMFEQGPAVVYNPDDNQYLVVWHRNNAATGEDIYGQLINGGGTFPAGEDNFQISTVTSDSDQMFPAAIYFAAMHRYAVIWQDDRDAVFQWDLRGQWLSSAGDVLGMFDLPIFRDYGVQANPAIVYAPGYNQALTVWYENSALGIYSIHGRFSALDTTPPHARFTRDPNWGHAGDTFTFNAWPSYDEQIQRSQVLVRWDLNSDGNWEYDWGHEKYITRTVLSPGVYTITLQAMNLAWLTDTVKHRIVVTGTTVLGPQLNQPDTPSASLMVTPTIATAGSVFKFDGRGSTGSGTVNGRWDFQNNGLFDTGWSTILTSTQVYTQAGDHLVRLELFDDSKTSHSDLVQFTVLPASFTGLEASPCLLKVIPKEVVKLRASAKDMYENEVFDPGGVTWSMLAPLAGAVDANGVFTASLKAGTYPNAVQVDLGLMSDTITVTVFYPVQLYLPTVRK